jgi:hypothetical protein
MVEDLVSKKALCSNSSAAKRKREKGIQRTVRA